MSNDTKYAVSDQSVELKHTYFFESTHAATSKQIIKAIQYSHVTVHEARPVFSLAFGDYDEAQDKIRDNVLTDNGDVYKVFNTILNTFPVFFEKCPQGLIFVAGSDSTDEFAEACRRSCNRSCHYVCRKQHRRMSAYCNYISKHYEQLIVDYEFHGHYFFRNGLYNHFAV